MDKETADLLNEAFPDEPPTEVDDEEVTLEASEEESEEEGAEEGEGVESEGIEPPKHWSPADREFFEAVDPEVQGWLMKRYKEIEAGADGKFQEAAKLRKENERLIEFAEQSQEIMRPVVEAYVNNGKSREQAVREMTAWFSAAMSPDPEVRRQIARQYMERAGISPSDLFGGEDDDLSDPEVKRLRQELSQVKNQQNMTAQQQQEAMRRYQQEQMAKAKEAADAEFAAFKAEKDDSGYLKHPHVDDERVYKLMGGLLAADQTLELEDAYDTAVNRFGLSKESPAAKIRRAKKAASGVRSKAETVDYSNLSPREVAEKVYDDIMGA